ncbi:MAG: hypothetical protein ACOYJE_01360 [Bacteroidaceae bacterium]|jgi:hypothetical protein
MGLLSKLNQKKEEKTAAIQARVEEYMTLIRVYYQAVMVVNMGITNINAAPDMALFKRTLRIPTMNGRLGMGEKARARKMLSEEYGLSNNFFTEIDASIKRNCKKQQDVQNYLYAFQGFSNDLMTLLGTTMQWKLRIPAAFKKTLFSATLQAMQDIGNPQKYWKKEDVNLMVRETRKLKEKLHYSAEWMAEFTFPIILMAKGSKKARL